MCKKLFGVFVCLLLIALLLTGSFAVSCEEGTPHEAQSLMEGILDCRTGNGTLQEWVDTELTENAGDISEWYILALRRYDKTLDLTRYADALEAYLDKATVTSASTRQKYALALIASGRENSRFVTATLKDSIGKQGIMSYVFGLHLLNLSLPANGYTAEGVVDTLLSRRLSDGGWAISGSISDVDVTAMALQALAPYTEDTRVKEAAEGAISYLSAAQKADGDFASFGTDNPESTAQVMMALCALGIDPLADARFIKNGNTLLDGMAKYRLADGAFSHTEGGAFNHNATSQTLCALVSYSLYEKQEGAFYHYEGIEYLPDESGEVESGESGESGNTDREMPKESGAFPLWRVIALGAILLVTLILLLLFWVKKRKGRDFLGLLGLAALLVIFVFVIDVKSPESYYQDEGPENVIGKVTFTVRCDTVADKAEGAFSDGVILPLGEYEIGEGDSVYDLLLRATKANKILVETGSGVSVYIYGIANLYEFDYGDLSGWVYTVNGKRPSVDCDSYILKDGDAVAFHYTLDLGKDILEGGASE